MKLRSHGASDWLRKINVILCVGFTGVLEWPWVTLSDLEWPWVTLSDLLSLEPKTGTPVTELMRRETLTVCRPVLLFFLRLYVFQLVFCTVQYRQKDRRTDGRTDKLRNAACRTVLWWQERSNWPGCRAECQVVPWPAWCSWVRWRIESWSQTASWLRRPDTSLAVCKPRPHQSLNQSINQSISKRACNTANTQTRSDDRFTAVIIDNVCRCQTQCCTISSPCKTSTTSSLSSTERPLAVHKPCRSILPAKLLYFAYVHQNLTENITSLVLSFDTTEFRRPAWRRK